MRRINFTLFIVLHLTVVSCGKNEKGMAGCQTLEQVMIQCIAEGIKIRPNPMDLWTVELDCERQYRVEQCYEKQEKYFPLDY